MKNFPNNAMPICRRYACHRVYDAAGHYFRQSVIALDEAGRVISIRPLTEETSFTEWLGGIILLSPFQRIEDFQDGDFAGLLPPQKEKVPNPLYAWHLSSFDFEHEVRTPGSILRKL